MEDRQSLLIDVGAKKFGYVKLAGIGIASGQERDVTVVSALHP